MSLINLGALGCVLLMRGSLMSTSSLNQLRCGSSFQPATIQNPRAVGQWMLGFNLPSFDGQKERDATHPQKSRCFGETQPTFGFALLFAITTDNVVAAQRDHPFPRPAIPHPGEQSVASECAYRRSRSALEPLRLSRSLPRWWGDCNRVAGEAGAVP